MHDDFMNAAMQFNSETLEPLYKLVIGKSGESNALWIANKMNVKEHVLKRAKEYMGNKEYALEKVNESKIRKPKFVQEKENLIMSTKSAIVLIYWIMMILVSSIRKKDNFITLLYIITVNSLK